MGWKIPIAAEVKCEGDCLICFDDREMMIGDPHALLGHAQNWEMNGAFRVRPKFQWQRLPEPPDEYMPDGVALTSAAHPGASGPPQTFEEANTPKDMTDTDPHDFGDAVETVEIEVRE